MRAVVGTQIMQIGKVATKQDCCNVNYTLAFIVTQIYAVINLFR